MDLFNRPAIIGAIASASFCVVLLSNFADLSPTPEAREALAHLIVFTAMMAMAYGALDIFSRFELGVRIFDLSLWWAGCVCLCVSMTGALYYLIAWMNTFKLTA